MSFDDLSVCGSLTSPSLAPTDFDQDLVSLPDMDHFDLSLGLATNLSSFEPVNKRPVLSQSQKKLGHLYNLLKGSRYKRPNPCYTESNFEVYVADVQVCDKVLRKKEMQFDSVCELLSNNTNEFLTETYIKSLLGKFPYRKLGKRKRPSESTFARSQKTRVY